LLGQWFCLVNEHDGDVVADFIEQYAGRTDKAIAFFGELDRTFALGTGENVEKFFLYHDKIGFRFQVSGFRFQE